MKWDRSDHAYRERRGKQSNEAKCAVCVAAECAIFPDEGSRDKAVLSKLSANYMLHLVGQVEERSICGGVGAEHNSQYTDSMTYRFVVHGFTAT